MLQIERLVDCSQVSVLARRWSMQCSGSSESRPVDCTRGGSVHEHSNIAKCCEVTVHYATVRNTTGRFPAVCMLSIVWH